MLESEAADMASHKAFEKAARSTRKRAKSEANTPPAAPPAGKADPDQQAGFFQDDDGLWYVEKRGDAFRPAAWVHGQWPARLSIGMPKRRRQAKDGPLPAKRLPKAAERTA